MDIKPPGPGRDKQIAELRGDGKRCVECVGCCMDDSICNLGCYNWQYPEYSTDIACAFELWDEMHESGLIMELRHYKESINVIFRQYYKTFNFYSGETIADAVSGAWLKYKMEG